MILLEDEFFLDYIFDEDGVDIVAARCGFCGVIDSAVWPESIDDHIHNVHGIEMSIVCEDDLIRWPQYRRVMGHD